MAIIVPNSGSTYTSDACVPNSEDRWAFLGLIPNAGASACVVWFQTASPTSGCQLLPLIVASGQPVMMGPFNSPCGLYAASISGGSAVVWLKNSTH